MNLRNDEAAFLDFTTGELNYNTNVEDPCLFREAALVLLGLNDLLRGGSRHWCLEAIHKDDAISRDMLRASIWEEVRKQLQEYYHVKWSDLRRKIKALELALLLGDDWAMAIAHLADRLNVRQAFAFRLAQALTKDSPYDFYEDSELEAYSSQSDEDEPPLPGICIVLRNYCILHDVTACRDYVAEIVTDSGSNPLYLIYRRNTLRYDTDVVIDNARGD